MRDLSQKGYTHDEVVNMLHGTYEPRDIRFRYDLLDKNEIKIDEIYEVESGHVEMSAFSMIKRTAKFRMREETVTEIVTEQATLEDYFDVRLGEM